MSDVVPEPVQPPGALPRPRVSAAADGADPLASVVGAAAAICAGELSCREATEESLRRIELLQADHDLNAFITVLGEQALADAERLDARLRDAGPLGPLHGVPVAVKDNLATAGVRTTGGTTLFADWVPDTDAAVVRRLREAGAVVVGKANLHEAAFGITCKNPHYGTVRNPWDPGRIAGGSSGGSAVAVAAGACPASLGTDTGGSVRVPAALCGLVGLKPSLGRVPSEGLMSLSRTCDAIGPLTRTVADAELLFRVLAAAGPRPSAETEPSLAGMRVGVAGGFFADLDPEVAALLETFLRTLGDGGALLEQRTVEGAEAGSAAGFDIVLPESWTLVETLLQEIEPGAALADRLDAFGADVRGVLASQGGPAATPVSGRAYLRALWEERPRLQRAFDRALDGVDVLVTATTPAPAVRVDEEPEMDFGGRRVPTFDTFIRNAFCVSVAGLPAITIPIGLSSEGLPVGAQLIAPRGADERLLDVARACEAAIARP